jgi:hypothetical protein
MQYEKRSRNRQGENLNEQPSSDPQMLVFKGINGALGYYDLPPLSAAALSTRLFPKADHHA